MCQIETHKKGFHGDKVGHFDDVRGQVGAKALSSYSTVLNVAWG